MNEAIKFDRTIAERKMGDRKMKTRLKYFFRTFFCLTVLLGSVLAGRADGAEPKPMNIVLFLIDDLGWRETFDPAGIELYDLGNDIGETKNLAATEATRTAELLEELNRWRVTVGAERMFPNPDFDPSEVPAKKSKKK